MSSDIIEKKSKPVYNSELFSFEMFENFEMTRAIFASEIDLVNRLHELRNDLRNELKCRKRSGNGNGNECERKTSSINATDVERLTRDFPVKGDFEGALRGLIFLYDTYKFDLKSLRSNKKMTKTGRKTFKNEHKLDSEDFFRLSKSAFSFRWYDSAIDFLRQAFKAADSASVSAKVKNRMEKMRKDLVTLNNGLLYQYKAAVRDVFKIHPYLVTSKLSKKKEQPEFRVKEHSTVSIQGRDGHRRG